MTVLFRKGQDNWRPASEAPYGHESELQRMLYDSPQLIPVVGGENVHRVFIREAGLPGSGNTDLLGVDADGRVYIVECKLADNPEVRRKVVGQVLEYAAFLWEMTYEEFDGLFVNREDKSLLELLAGKLGGQQSAEEFRARVSENLKNGLFHLVIAVDKMNEELEQIIRYLNRSGTRVPLEALEMRLYRDGEVEILVPEIHGREIQIASSPGRIKITIEQVLQRCPDAISRSRLQKLVDLWKGLGHVVETGTKGLSFRATVGNDVRPVFWAPNPTFVSVDFSWLLNEGLPERSVEEYRQQIAEIHGFEKQKVLTQSAPRAQLVNLRDEDVGAIARANDMLVSAWRATMNG